MTNKEMIPGESYKPREFFTGGGPKQHQPITGSVTAIDAKSGAIVAKHETEYPMLGGIRTTAGGLVFTGHPSGEVVALDAETLDELWRFETGSGINAPPITYSVGGKQYVALLVGPAAPGRSGSSTAPRGWRRSSPPRCSTCSRSELLRCPGRAGMRRSALFSRQRIASHSLGTLTPERRSPRRWLAPALEIFDHVVGDRLDLLGAQESRRLGREVGAEVGLGHTAVARGALIRGSGRDRAYASPAGRSGSPRSARRALERGLAQRQRRAAIAAAAAAVPLVAADAIAFSYTRRPRSTAPGHTPARRSCSGRPAERSWRRGMQFLRQSCVAPPDGCRHFREAILRL